MEIIIKFSNGHMFGLDADIIANMRTEYYSSVDGFEKDSPEWNTEYNNSLNKDELLDWLSNNVNWEDIEEHVYRLDPKVYDYKHMFYNAKCKVVDL